MARLDTGRFLTTPGYTWDDLPRELHCKVLRLLPLEYATLARWASKMRGEVDEIWGSWGLRAAPFDGTNRVPPGGNLAEEFTLSGPLHVWLHNGSHAHHLASVGKPWLAVMVSEPGLAMNEPWDEVPFAFAHPPDTHVHSPLSLAVQAKVPVGYDMVRFIRWGYALGDEEMARMVRAAVAMGVDINRTLHSTGPLLGSCAGRGLVRAVRACLKAGAEVDARSTWNGSMALFFAAHGGHEAVVDVLLEVGASAELAVTTGDPTLVAVCTGSPTPAIVRRLVEEGAHLSGGALLSASMFGNVPVLEALVELGLDVRASFDGTTAMHVAKNRDVAQWLAARGASVQGDGGGPSPLQRACSTGRLDVVYALINLGADVHWRDGEGRTAAHAAVCAANLDSEPSDPAVFGLPLDMLDVLIMAGADVTVADNHGVTPLHLTRCVECVDLLVETGVPVDAQDTAGRTPLFSACVPIEGLPQAKPDPKAFDMLVFCGADTRVTVGGANLVHQVTKYCGHYHISHRERVECGWPRALSTALEALDGARGNDVNSKDGEGSTALHHAAQGIWVEGIRILLAASASPHVSNADGNTPLHLAAVKDQPSLKDPYLKQLISACVEALLRAGADPAAVNNAGAQALSEGMQAQFAAKLATAAP